MNEAKGRNSSTSPYERQKGSRGSISRYVGYLMRCCNAVIKVDDVVYAYAGMDVGGRKVEGAGEQGGGVLFTNPSCDNRQYRPRSS